MTTGHEVRAEWVARVRLHTGSDSYTIQSCDRWNKVFQQVAELVTNNRWDVRRYVDCQVLWALAQNKPNILFPTVLIRAAAISDFMSHQPETRDELIAYYQLQAQAFARVCNQVGEDLALSNRVLNLSPLFLGFFRWKTGRPLSEEAGVQALKELQTRELSRELFPAEFVQQLEAMYGRL